MNISGKAGLPRRELRVIGLLAKGATTQDLVAKLGGKKPVVLNYIHFCYVAGSEDAGFLRTDLVPQNLYEPSAAAIVAGYGVLALPALRAGDIDNRDGLCFPARRRGFRVVRSQCLTA